MRYTNLGVNGYPLLQAAHAAGIRTWTREKVKIGSIEQYESLMKAKRLFVVDFTRSCQETGKRVLDTFDENGIRIKMYEAEALYDDEFRNESAALGRAYEVLVVAVDKKKREVTVSYRAAYEVQRKIVCRNLSRLLNAQTECMNGVEKAVADALNEQMRHELRDVVSGMKSTNAHNLLAARRHEILIEKMNEWDNQWIVEPAVVKYVDSDKAYVDILGYNIPAVLPKQYFSFTHIARLNSLLSIGDIVDVAIFGTQRIASGYERGRHETKMYVVARTPLIDNPWSDLPLKVGDEIELLCTNKKADNWYGVICDKENIDSRLKDIEIECKNPKRMVRQVILGQTYPCIIYRIQKESRRIIARIK